LRSTHLFFGRVFGKSIESFFVLTVAFGQILTLDNLTKGIVIIVELCCMCKRSGESIAHVLIHCELAKEFLECDF
jgi:hypothetical protein